MCTGGVILRITSQVRQELCVCNLALSVALRLRIGGELPCFARDQSYSTTDRIRRQNFPSRPPAETVCETWRDGLQCISDAEKTLL
jgi:hypothetical protein